MDRQRILVVEDDPVLRQAICAFLQIHGFDFQTAADGGNALELITNDLFDLVLCDANLPDIGGYEILRFVRETQDGYVPFIFLTAYADKREVALELYIGQEERMTRPFTNTELLNMISRALSMGWDSVHSFKNKRTHEGN